MPDRPPQRDKSTIPAKVTANCTRAEKIRWIKAAERAGAKLEPWVVRVLNEAADQDSRTTGGQDNGER